MCDAYESKVTSLTRKQDALKEAADRTSEQLDSLILERDKALLKIEQL